MANMANIPNQGSGQSPTTYQWVVAWVLVLVLAMLALRTQVGYKLVYYGLVLILVFLLVTQYQFIAAGLAPIGQPAPQEGQ
jgi:hypothetical protein